MKKLSFLLLCLFNNPFFFVPSERKYYIVPESNIQITAENKNPSVSFFFFQGGIRASLHVWVYKPKMKLMVFCVSSCLPFAVFCEPAHKTCLTLFVFGFADLTVCPDEGCSCCFLRVLDLLGQPRLLALQEK